MKINQQGIGAVGVILVIAVLGLVGFAGWYIAKENSKNNNKTSSSQQETQTTTYTDSSDTYTVKVPSKWTVKEADECCEGAMPDYTKVSRAVDFVPDDATKGNAIHVLADSGTQESKALWKDSGGSLAAHIRKHWQDNSHTPEAETVNGYEAQYVRVHFKGDAEEYVDHQYLIVDGERSVYLNFREYHNHPMSDNVWNDVKHLVDFRKIVGSVAFEKH